MSSLGTPIGELKYTAAFPGREQGLIFTGVTRVSICPKNSSIAGDLLRLRGRCKLLPFAVEEFGDQCWVYGSETIKIWLQVPAAEISQNVMIESRELGKASGRLTGA